MQLDFRLLSAIRLHKFLAHRDEYIAGKQTANGQQCTAHNGHILTRRSMPEMDPRSKLQKGILRRPAKSMGGEQKKTTRSWNLLENKSGHALTSKHFYGHYFRRPPQLQRGRERERGKKARILQPIGYLTSVFGCRQQSCHNYHGFQIFLAA